MDTKRNEKHMQYNVGGFVSIKVIHLVQKILGDAANAYGIRGIRLGINP